MGRTLALDRAVFGADRTAVLTGWHPPPGRSWSQNMIAAWPAHAAAWRVGGKLIIGLVVAQDDTTAPGAHPCRHWAEGPRTASLGISNTT